MTCCHRVPQNEDARFPEKIAVLLAFRRKSPNDGEPSSINMPWTSAQKGYDAAGSLTPQAIAVEPLTTWTMPLLRHKSMRVPISERASMTFDSIRRVNYRSAPSCLTAVNISRDFERFHLPLHQLHNRVLHGAGIMAGLDVTVSDDGFGVVVSAGMALDPLGRMLLLSDNGLAAVGEPPEKVSVPVLVPLPTERISANLTLIMESGEDLSVPIDPANPTGCKQIEDCPRLRFVAVDAELTPGTTTLCEVTITEQGKISDISFVRRSQGINASVIAQVMAEVTTLRTQVAESVLSLSQLAGRIATETQTLSVLTNQVQQLKQRLEAPTMTTIWVHGSEGRLKEENGIAGPNDPFTKEDHGYMALTVTFKPNKSATLFTFIPIQFEHRLNASSQVPKLRRLFIKGTGSDGARIIRVESQSFNQVFLSQDADLTGDFSTVGDANTFTLDTPVAIDGGLAILVRCQSGSSDPRRAGVLQLIAFGAEFEH